MLDWFEYQGHVCIVFELLGPSTYNFLKENCSLPFRLEHIRRMAYQICKAVSFLHVSKLTHTDLKPENILLVSSDYTEEYNSSLVSCCPLLHLPLCHPMPFFRLSHPISSLQKYVVHRLKRPDIKVADFGSTVLVHEPRCYPVTTRPYRAPEVILGQWKSLRCSFGPRSFAALLKGANNCGTSWLSC
ncbi:dual specificity protein kinase CLK1-like [Heliangelus exortis]|uniref:dual specificity protein kinase CLK1-like n=1 Tax=Heliangelus exortis TaxID=472823 RepID=UPI003A8D941C